MWAVVVAIWNLLYLIIKLPLDNPLLSLLLALGWFLYLKRHELENSGPIVVAIHQQFAQIFGTNLARKELPWIETTVTHLIGQYCINQLDSLRLRSGFFIGGCEVNQSWVTECSAQRTKSLILRGTLKATVEVDIRHLKFHGDWRGFVRLQANFLVYHGRETGMDVQLNKISVNSNVSEDVPNIDEAVVAALSRGFQLTSLTGAKTLSQNQHQQESINTSQLSLDKSNSGYSSGYSSGRFSQNDVTGSSSRRSIVEEESGRESRMSRFSVREEEQRANRERKISRESRHSVRLQERNDQVSSQPPKPTRASKNSPSSTSRTPKNSRSSHGSSRKKAVETVKINPVRIELYHEWDNIKPRLNVTYGSKTVHFDGIQSEHGDEIFDFDTSSPLQTDFKRDEVVDLSLTVKDQQGKWLSIGKGTVDLENLQDSSITLELSDPEETICELTLKIKRSKPKSEVIFDDRVQFSPSRRTDIYPESSARANSTIRHSMTMTESSMDGLDTDQNTLEISHNDHDSWIDHNLVDEVCRVHKLTPERENETSTPIPSPLARGDELRSTLPLVESYGNDNRPRKMSLQDMSKQQNAVSRRKSDLDLLQIPTENMNKFPASPKSGKSGLKKFFGKFKRSRPGSRNRSEATTPTISRK